MRLPLLGLLILGLAVLGNPASPAADEPNPDEMLLKGAKVGTEPADLLAVLHKQVLSDKEREQIEALIRQLGNEEFKTRESATDKLLAIGAAAAPFLREASRSANLEVAQRASQALAEIPNAADSGLTGAAVRLLARKPTADTLGALLEFFPFAGDDWLEDEILTAIGTNAMPNGKVDPVLMKALKDPLPARRGAAAAVLGRWGATDQREAVRPILSDPSPKARALAARGLLGDRYARPDAALSPEDRKILKDGGVESDAAGLLAFIRKRTLSPEDRKELARMVEQLDSAVFTERQEATKKLILTGTPALSYLRPALEGSGLELRRRIEYCIKDIEKGPGPMVPITAAKLLARRAPAEASKVLIDYLPFADDAIVEEEVLNAIARLAVQEAEVPAALVATLKEEDAARRAGAALVLALVGTKDHCDKVKALLNDASPVVRFRAAQGMLAAKERAAVPVLLALLGEGPAAIALQAEDLLRLLASDRAPAASVRGAAAEARKKAHEDWVAWHRDHGDKVDLTIAFRERPHLGLTLVSELGGGRGGRNQRVWEYGRDGKARWTINDLVNPIDAHMLPGNRVLVADYNGNKVVERDLASGKNVWEHPTTGIAVSCQRLPNGNTFIATYNTGYLEVTPEKKQVYAHNPVANFGGMVNAIKLRNGNIACMTANGQFIELDANAKQVHMQMIDQNGGWNGIEELPGNHLLLAIQSPGSVIELDASRKKVGEWKAAGAVHAIRLPGGNLLVACGNNQKVVELDRKGVVVSEQATTGRPFHVRRR